jgi:hypothetical protein
MSKPLWKDAPTWAMWLAQDKDGEWCWWSLRPDRTASLWTQPQPNEDLCDYLSAGYLDRDGGRFTLPEDWTKTLEPRP